MTAPTLTLRDLNRATLARQLLLKRESISPLLAIEKVLGLQAQIPNPPYIGLWTRLENYERDTLTQLMDARQVVRAAMMRSTLQVMTAEDHQRFRPTLQPALERALRSFFGKKARGLDIDAIVAVAEPFMTAEPRTTGELRAHLLEHFSDADGDAMAYVVRVHLPLVQIPPTGTWGTGSGGTYLPAESVLGAFQPADLKALFFRYLAAFGPASVMDFQTWAGITKLKSTIEAWRDELRMYQDENGKELFDLPELAIPEDVPVPVRFIPEYDNLLIAHADRNRVIADADRTKVFLSAGRVLGTILLDGFVAGTWKISTRRGKATLNITTFQPLNAASTEALTIEGAELLRFVEDGADEYDITFLRGDDA